MIRNLLMFVVFAGAAQGIIKVGDANIEYFSYGSGKAVVMLPGAGHAAGYLEDLAQDLAEAGYRAVLVNPRGAGKSTGPDAGITYHTLAADVTAVIKSLKLEPVCILGHAFGNRVARTLAADYPELVDSVVLLAAGGKIPPESQTGRIASKTTDADASEAERIEGFRFMVGDPALAAEVQRKLEPYRAPAAMNIQNKATAATPLSDWWAPKGKARFLVLQGLKDRGAPPQNGRLLKEELGERVTLVEFPNSGHMLPLEETDKVAAAILRFLQAR